MDEDDQNTQAQFAVTVEQIICDTEIHGFAECCICGKWCVLGSETSELVNSGDAWAICHLCAEKIPPGSRPIDTYTDVRRADLN